MLKKSVAKAIFVILLSFFIFALCFACASTAPTTRISTKPAITNLNIISYHFFKTDFELVRSPEGIILRTKIGKERDPQFLRIRLGAQLRAEILRLVAGAQENLPDINIILEDLDGRIRNSEVSLTSLSPEGYAYIDLKGGPLTEKTCYRW